MTKPTLDSDDSRTNLSSRTAPDAEPASTPVDAPKKERRPTRTGDLHAGLVIAALLLVLLVVFLAQNGHNVTIHFLGAHLRVSMAVALLTAALAGALIVGVAGTARITQLRLHSRRAARRGRTDRR